MTRRRVFVAIAVVLVLIGGSLAAVRFWLSSDGARHRLERVLSAALHREVTITRMQVQPGRGSVELTGVTVANPAGWDGPALLEAERIQLELELDDALDRELDGTVRASGLQLRIAKRDGTTNLHGMVQPKERDEGAELVDLHLDVEITGSQAVLEDLDRDEELRLDGVALGVLLSNRGDVKDVEVDLDVDAMTVRGVGLEQIEVEAVGGADDIALRRFAARIGDDGRIDGSGLVQLDAQTDWGADLSIRDVALDDDVLPIVAAFYPPAAGVAASPDADVEGTTDATLHLSGRGFAWPAMMPTLAGNGSVTLRDLVLPEDALAVKLAALGGRERGPLKLGTTTAHVQIGGGWVTLVRVDNDGATLDLPVTGRVGLDGTLDLDVDLMPLVRAYGGGIYTSIARTTSSIPMRIEGTVDAPDFEPPTAAAVAEGLLGGLVHRALGE